MKITENSIQIVNELYNTAKLISEREAEVFVDHILQAKRVFVGGAGRSGLMGHSFAMRLMHIGLSVYVIGEVVTPSIKKDDLLIFGTGSGETKSLVGMGEKAKSIGTSIGVVTKFPKSTTGQLADFTVKIPVPNSTIEDEINSIQPMGSLFEQSLLLFYDSIIIRLMEHLEIDSTQMFSRHANLE
ncbi:6-phospho-3-hexuloisomerase [Lederbergia citrea]|uniref:6-phospho-3-hexuloisomerase n=1 Tax=Lederbergia citrea TaxID=2833581 RepID=A0A942Z3V5_9BACI|nr:6-phospho-3-hexuloisomerase [Lederbergia citrea]MBS4221745.1 6-phospho-3-hexuloisomerase [Lederbergia citrea]